MASSILEFNYDISCPFAYIASTRIKALTERTNAHLVYRPVLLGAIYRETAAPQGAAGSASDVYNPTKKAVVAVSMQRTLKRYKVQYNPPPEHPRKTVNALRLLYCVEEGEERRVLSDALFKAYWVEGRDISNSDELLKIVNETGIKSATKLSAASFKDANARKELETATADALERGAFGVPGFWIPAAQWINFNLEVHQGRFYWGQDRMHFVEATLLSIRDNNEWNRVAGLRSLMPRVIPSNKVHEKVKVEFWYDFSSPWGFMGCTQLERLKRTFGPALQVVMKPFLLGILFREIGAPNLPTTLLSPMKSLYSTQDYIDWTYYWNAVNSQEGDQDKRIAFQWRHLFPFRTPTLLRVALVEPTTVPLLYSACWELNANVSDDEVLCEVLDKGGYAGADLIAKSNAPAVKAKLREFTAEAKENGICGVPTYRVLRQSGDGEWQPVGGLVWGQDEINVVEDLIAGWDPKSADNIAVPRRVNYESGKIGAKL